MTNVQTAGQVVQEQKSSRASSVWFGLILVALGLLLTLNRLDVAPALSLGRIWPVAIIGAGAAKIYDSWGTPAAGSGMGLVMTGVWFLLINFRIFGLTYQNAWPLIIVGVGISIMWHAFLEERSGTMRREDGNGR